jgi:hypothetical protein
MPPQLLRGAAATCKVPLGSLLLQLLLLLAGCCCWCGALLWLLLWR